MGSGTRNDRLHRGVCPYRPASLVSSRRAGSQGEHERPPQAIRRRMRHCWVAHGRRHVHHATEKVVVCPECGWRPGHGRKPHQGPVGQLANSVAVHRAKAHGVRKWDTEETEFAGWDALIYQSKPIQVVALRTLLAPFPHSETSRQRNVNHLRSYQFILRREYATDLLKRARWGERPSRSSCSPSRRSSARRGLTR
jgi:hypothetical protein